MPIYMNISKSNAKNKKFTAVFFHYKDGKKVKIKTTQFGDSRYEDYTQHKDKERRKLYRGRHKKDLSKGTYMNAGYLSFYLLWGDSTSLQSNISNYKKMFKLK
tara:strand:+ start:539 stop:847 length:309 start_codon:yes stop_codon:yes gene_type:complete